MTKQKRLPPLEACQQCRNYPEPWYLSRELRFKCGACGFSIREYAPIHEAVKLWNEAQKERAKA